MAVVQPRSFGELLKRFRTASGQTQAELAERAHMSQRTITSLETGTRALPHKETVALLVEALNLTSAERTQLEAAARQRPLAPFGPLAAPVPGLTARPPRTLPPLTGRREELMALGRQLAGEDLPFLMLTGEPGIGKSRLLLEVAQRAREQGWTVLCASCHRRSAQEPYAPFVDAFLRFLASRPVVQRRVDLHGCSWLARLLPELAEYAIGPSPSWNLSAEQERRLMFAAVERFLANVVGPAGTLLLLDDLQWAGCDALDLLAFLLRESATSGLCANLRIVGAYRDTDVARHDLLPLLLADLTRESLAATRRLAPLCRADARNLLATSLADSARDQPALIEPALIEPALIEPALIEPVLDRADGVPFFLVAWASELCAGTCSPDVALHTIPPSVRECIRQRVVVLPEVVRDVMAVAAVACGSVSLPVLLTAAGRVSARTIRQEAELLSGVEAACTAGLLCESAENGYRFRREIVRETVLDDLGGARRAILRREIDAALHAHANFASSGRCAGGRGRLVRGCRQ